LDGPLPKLCPAVTLSHQDGRHSAVALLRGVASLEGGNLVVFYYLSASEIWQGPGCSMSLGSWITKQLKQAYHQYGVVLHPAL
jgi:hypothetical protein